jgi:hypothetical protein
MTSPDAIKAELILLTNDESLAGKLFAKMRNARMVDSATNIRAIQSILDGKEPEHQQALSNKLESIAEAVMHSHAVQTTQVGKTLKLPTAMYTYIGLCLL